MGWFVIGILVGWFAEWVFFNFFVKGKSESTDNSNSNTSALQEELSSKNKEIRALEAKLAENGNTAATSASSGTGSSTTASQSASNKKPAVKTVAKATTKTTATSKPATKKAAPKKSVTKTAKPKAAAKKASTKKVTPKKAVTKKTPAKAKVKGDDFTRLSGVGPSMASTLNDLGIDTFKKLAAMDDDILRDMLEASGARLNNNKEAMATWNEQAILADKGDIAGLKKLQDSLKG